MLYLAELDARKYYGIKLLQSIVIHSSSKMHGYVRHEFLLFSYILQPHKEVVPAFADEPPGY